MILIIIFIEWTENCIDNFGIPFLISHTSHKNYRMPKYVPSAVVRITSVLMHAYTYKFIKVIRVCVFAHNAMF